MSSLVLGGPGHGRWLGLATDCVLLLQMSEAEMNGQFESVCESVFSEAESQAMDALDLPGCFRTRSHSYLRAIQAGYSQDEECGPASTPPSTAATIRSAAGKSACVASRGAQPLHAGKRHPAEVPYLGQVALYALSHLRWGWKHFFHD